MILMVTMRAALEQRYGHGNYEEIRSAIADFGTAAGAETVALDDSDEMSALSAGPALGPDSGSILSCIRQFMPAIPRTMSLLIVGGDEIVPYWRVINPVTDRSIDADTQVLSDNPYGSIRDSWEEYLAPSISVGRLTDFAKGSAQDFLGLLGTAKSLREDRPARSSSAAVVNSDWLSFSQTAASSIPGPTDWHVAPGYVLNAGTAPDTDHECLYFNLHGFSGQAAWQGYDDVRSTFVKAVTPDAFTSQYVSGTVVFAENCYGAETIGRTPNNSCALRLVQQGAAMVGATGVAYGSYLTPDSLLDDADELAQFFWNGYAGGLPLGRALQYAKTQYLGDDSAAATNVFKKKTLLQFVLLGDPGWTAN